MSEGQVAQLDTPSLLVADSTGSRPWQPPPSSGSDTGTLDWCSNLPYCPATRRVMATGGRPASLSSAQKLIYFDVASSKWDAVANPFGASGGHLYQSQCVSVELRRFFYVNVSGDRIVRMWNTQTWQAAGTLPAIPGFAAGPAAWGDAICLMWHPNLGFQGSLVVSGGDANWSRIARFDWASQTWSEIAAINGAGSLREGHNAGVYVPSANAVITGKSSSSVPRALYRVNADGTFAPTTACPSTLSAFSGQGILTSHPSRAAAIHLCPATNRIWTYEFTSNVWVDRGALPAAFDVSYQAGSTIPELGIVLSVSGGNGAPIGAMTWVYKVPNSV